MVIIQKAINSLRKASAQFLRKSIPRGQPFQSIVSKSTYSSSAVYSSQKLSSETLPQSYLSGSIFARFYSKEDSRLLDVLKKEISHEQTTYLGEDGFDKTPPSSFKLVDKPGCAETILERNYENEKISLMVDSRAVNFNLDNESEEREEGEGGDEDESSQNAISARLVISKNAIPYKLEFDLSLEGASWIINNVARNILEDSDEFLPYEGPDYGKKIRMLDPKLQEELENFLMKRGIDMDLAEYVRLCLNEKEQKEYVRWLKDISDFVNK